MIKLIQNSSPLLRRITSTHNPVIQLIRALARHRERRYSGLFIAEGAKIIASGRDCGWIPRFLFIPEEFDLNLNSRTYSKLITWAIACGTTCYRLPGSVFTRITSKSYQIDIIGIFSQRWNTLPLSPDEADIWVALERIRDPGNLGTIIRTSAAVGARGIILVGFCCDPYAREAVRATMGSIFHISLVQTDFKSFQHWMITWPGEVLGTQLTANQDFRQHYHTPILLLMGNEGMGLSSTLSQLCTSLVKIPMMGQIDSLNLATATSLMLYEIQRNIL